MQINNFVFNRLWINSCYSFLKSGVTIDEYIDYAKRSKWKWLSLIEKNNTFSFYKFIEKCEKNNLKPILGLEFEYKNQIVLLIARNNNGLKILFCLSSLILSKKNIYKYIEKIITNGDLIFISNLSHEFIKSKYFFRLSEINIEKTNYYDINSYKRHYFLSNFISNIKNSAKEYSTFFKNKIFICVQNEEIVNKIISMCEYNYNFFKQISSSSLENNKKLIQYAWKGLEKRFAHNFIPNLYKKRLEYELKIVTSLNYSSYILNVFDYVRYARSKNILIGPGRGSSVSSLLCFSLYITSIDPIKYDLIFERFLNKYRIERPDIDIDFEDIKRNQIINNLQKKYSVNNCAQIITFTNYGVKQAILFMLKIIKVNNYDSLINQYKKIFYIDNLNTSMNFRETRNIDFYKLKETSYFKTLLNENTPNHTIWIFINENIKYILGIPKNYSTHASGIVISNKNIVENLGIINSKYQTLVQKDMHDLSKLNYDKYDILGLANLTTIKNIIDLIYKNTKRKLSFSNVDLNNKKTYELLSSGNTNGIFQLESKGIKELIQKIKPNNFNDIVILLSLYRPGPKNNINLFLKNRNNISNIKYVNPTYKKITESTYGILIFQEQLIRFVQEIAGFSLSKSDHFRAIISKKNENKMRNIKADFIKGCISNGYNKYESQSFFEKIVSFIHYGFNKAHATSYALITYFSAYLKANYLLYFSISYMNNIDFSKKAILKSYIKYLNQNNISVLEPNFYYSSENFSLHKNSIYKPFHFITGISENVSKKIIESIKDKNINHIKDIFFYICKFVKKNEMLILINHGCFNIFGYKKELLLKNINKIYMWANLQCNDIEFVDLNKDIDK